MNKNFLSILLIAFSSSLYSNDIPFLVLNKNGKDVKQVTISEHSYSRFINKSLRRALRKREARKVAPDYYLDFLVIGLATDVRVGFLNWNLSASHAVEFHMRIIQ